MSNKTCSKCREEINDLASVCPHCQSSQSLFERYLARPNFFSSLLFVFLVLFIYRDMQADSNTYNKNSVDIQVLSYSITKTECGKKIAIFAEVENKTNTKLHQLYFDIEATSKSGELKEAFSDSVYGLSLLPNEKKTIELSQSMASLEENEYIFEVQLSRANTKI